MSRRQRRRGAPRPKIVLILGFVLLTIGLLAAYVEPASGYELSPYASTPIPFWACTALSGFVSLVVAFDRDRSPRLRTIALLLAVGVFVAVISIPVIRNYQFFGPADSLTHLGWIRDFRTGALQPFDILYPATHVIALLFGEVGGIELPRAGKLTVVVYFVVYLLFLPLCVGYLSDSDWAIPFGLFAAALLLPVNNVSVFRMMHPTTQAILFFPLVLFVTFRYLRAPPDAEWLPFSASSWSVLLYVVMASLLFVHPQQAANLLVVFVTISVVQTIYRAAGDRLGDYDIVTERLAYFPAIFLAVLFGLWVPQHGRATGPGSIIIDRVIQFVTGTSESPVDGAAQRGRSLGDIGGSIEELFVKLFLVTLLFFIAAGLLMLLSYVGRIDWKDVDKRAVIKYLSISFSALTAIFAVYFLSSVTTQHYRQLGLLAMVASILGAVMLSDGLTALADRFSVRSVVGIAGPLLAVMLLLSAASVYQSPYIYQESAHITEMELTGYETAIDHRSDEVIFTKIRGGTSRYSDAVYGRNGSEQMDINRADEPIPEGVFNRGNMTTYYDDPHYLVVLPRDYDREVVVYKGFRFTSRGFDQLDELSGVSKLISNKGFQLYYIEPANETETVGPNDAVSGPERPTFSVPSPTR
ncbi:hypothetical protein [Halorubrum halophilum]|uniref:hypothetical protein n=1 Tax=Halorubrum halophilum TaxID=413816 RepID=UPI000679E655|nr:hypothetical protein [Halorubrum halophilum]